MVTRDISTAARASRDTHLPKTHAHAHTFPCVAGVCYELHGARKRWIVPAVGFLGWVLRQVRVREQLSSDSQSVPMPSMPGASLANHWR